MLNGNNVRLANEIRFDALIQRIPPGWPILGARQRGTRRSDAPRAADAAMGRIPERHFDMLGGRSLGYVVADRHLRTESSTTP